MDTKILNIKLESNGKELLVGKGHLYRLLSIDGIDSGNIEISHVVNGMHDGSTVNNKKIKSRHIALEAEYKGPDMDLERRALAGFFSPKQEGSLTLEFANHTKKIDYVVEGYKSRLKNLYRPTTFLVDLFCPQPYFRDANEVNENIRQWRGSFEFPLNLYDGFEFGYREQTPFATLMNSGDEACGMEIRFKALGTPVGNPSLFNVETREFIKINKTMAIGEEVVVTTHFRNKKVVIIDGDIKTNGFHYVDLTESTFLQLLPGENVVRAMADENLDNLEVNIYYSPQYLGV